MNQQFISDLKKHIQNSQVNQELSPGTTPRRFEPSGGIEKHKRKIHKDSKFADTHKNLPFSFRKPPKLTGRSVYIKCSNCGFISCGTVNTVAIICKQCNKFSQVLEVVEE